MNVGILGGGQLGRMLALAGIPLGHQFRVLEPATECPAEVVAHRIRADFDDRDALARFADGLDVVTYEFENVPVDSARWLAERVPVRPGPDALAMTQDRIVEKSFLRDLGIPVPSFAAVSDREGLIESVNQLGLPAVLKTRRFGYDGRGQFVLQTPTDVETAWSELGGHELILESFVNFDREFSVIAVRSLSGEVCFYPTVENVHRRGMLFRSTVPAAVDEDLTQMARGYVQQVFERLDYVGVLTAEWFQRGNEILLNELAPRVHNSGHWTIEGAVTSQFENHIRAIIGWPLGDVTTTGRVIMWNVIGLMPNPAAVLSIPGSHYHWYGKLTKPGRKLGHVTLVECESHSNVEHHLECERIVTGCV